MNPVTEPRHVKLIRYVTPLREGGSLPAITEADDGFLYVAKFRGAGQGPKALIAELIGGELARALGLKVPELVFLTLDEAFGRTEPDEEIQDLLKASIGLNLGLHYLSGSISYDPVITKVDSLLASKIVWLDCLIMNVDRTPRNTNMLLWNKEIWLIDHGAGFYIHHGWKPGDAENQRAFVYVKDHVLLPQAADLAKADAICRKLISDEVIESIISMIPDTWLIPDNSFETAAQNREAYAIFLKSRIKQSDLFTKEAMDARSVII